MIKNYLFYLNQNAEATYKREFVKYVAQCNVPKNGMLLDVGCNDGEFTLQIGDLIGAKNIFGIEKNDIAIEKAKKRGIKIFNLDISEKIWKDVPDNSFDLVISNQVIEHLFDVDNYLKNIYRITKPNGKVIIATENLAGWHNIFSLLLGYQPFSMTNFCTTRSTIGNPLTIWKSVV